MSNTKFNVTVGRLLAQGWGLAVGRMILSWLVIHPSWSLETVYPSGFPDGLTGTTPEPFLHQCQASSGQDFFQQHLLLPFVAVWVSSSSLRPLRSYRQCLAATVFLSIRLDQPFSTWIPHQNYIPKTDFNDYFIIIPRLHN